MARHATLEQILSFYAGDKEIYFDGTFLDRQGGIGRDSRSLYEKVKHKSTTILFSDQENAISKSKIMKLKYSRKSQNLRMVILKKPRKIKIESDTVFIQPQVSSIAANSSVHILRVHDIFPVTNPEWFPRRQVHLFKNGLKTISKNTIIIFDSMYSQEQFNLHFHPEVMAQYVVHCEVAPLSKESCQKCEGCEYTLENFVLAVGTFEPRKNYKTIIESWQLLDQKRNLVIVGGKGWLTQNLQEKLENETAIRHLKTCCDGALSKLYSSCDLFLSLSLDEGFNIPIFEAKNYDCTILASDIPVHRELHGNSIHYVSSTEPTEVANFVSTFYQNQPK